MACSICGTEGHNRSTCSANPQHVARRRARRRVLFLWVVLAAVWGVYVLVTGPKLDRPVETSLDAGAPPRKPTEARPTDAGRLPRKLGTPRPYDDAGLVDGSIPGAPPGWKPSRMPPAPDGGSPVQ